MDTSILKALPDDVVRALCNTLLHSLWQGLVLAAVAGLVVVFTRKATSAMRYNLLVGALCLFAAGVVYTFADQLSIAKSSPGKAFAYDLTHAQFQKIDTTIPINTHSNFTDSLLGYLNTHANIIVLIWLLVVCARSIQLVTGLNGLYHLKRRYVFEIDRHWHDRVEELSAKLGIKRMVRVAESGIAKVPMVIGHLKPIILIPIGLVTALSTDEVDAILVHELAHVRRRDHLVNLLQSFMEIVFFFNPAVLWISTLIKAERENCCDDIAIAQTSNKASYIRALVSCQEYQLSAPAYAMAFGGEKSGLLNRVKRMVSNNNRSLNLMERSLLAICLLGAMLITTAFSNSDKIDKLVTATTKAVAHMGNAVKTELIPEVAEVQMPKNIAAFSPTVCEIKPEFLPAAFAKTDTPKVDPKPQLGQLNVNVSGLGSLVGKLGPLNALSIDDEINAAVDSAKQVTRAKRKTGYSYNVPAIAAPVTPAYNYDASRQDYTRAAAKYVPYKSNKDDSLRAAIISDMVGDGIIKEKHDDLSFKISTSEFIVNGKKQSDDVYRKYRAKYVKANGHDEWSWYYNYNTATKARTEQKSTTTSSGNTSKSSGN